MTIRQTENIAGGDIVGGNKTVTIVAPSAKGHIDVLNERYKAESGNAEGLSGFICELQHFWNRATDPDIRGLAAKLRESERSDIIHAGEVLKEKATMKIVKYQTSPSAQEIFVWALTEMYGRYLLEVTPRIQAGLGRPEIDTLINEKVIDPVLQGLGENVLHLYRDEIIGLMFFLAGNCHIRWDKTC